MFPQDGAIETEGAPRLRNRGNNRQRIVPDGVLDREAVSMQRDRRITRLESSGSGELSLRSILTVTNNRPAPTSELNTDLMHPPGQQLNLHDRPAFRLRDRAVPEFSMLRPFSAFARQLNPRLIRH